MKVDFIQGEGQVVVLALAMLALSRPGWEPMLAEIAAVHFHALDLFNEFMRLNADRVKILCPVSGEVD